MQSDVVCPINNEFELASTAKQLGFKEIIFLYHAVVPPKNIDLPGLMIKRAYLAKHPRDVPSPKAGFNFIFARSDRAFFESKIINYVIDSESSESPDFFYQKRGGLDDAMCKLAKENHIIVVFSVQSSDDKTILGRLEQNARLCRKHHAAFLVATLAKTPLDMRSPKDMDAFSRMIRLI
jgi:hypothetical protein